MLLLCWRCCCQRLVLSWGHRCQPALALSLGWDGMAAIAGDDFGDLYRLRSSPCNFLPEVSVSRQSEWFEQSFYTDADSPLPVVALP